MVWEGNSASEQPAGGGMPECDPHWEGRQEPAGFGRRTFKQLQSECPATFQPDLKTDTCQDTERLERPTMSCAQGLQCRKEL